MNTSYMKFCQLLETKTCQLLKTEPVGY